MPVLGEIQQGRNIGRKSGRWSWVQCPACGEERWAIWRLTNGSHRTCSPCNLNNQKATFKLAQK